MTISFFSVILGFVSQIVEFKCCGVSIKMKARLSMKIGKVIVSKNIAKIAVTLVFGAFLAGCSTGSFLGGGEQPTESAKTALANIEVAQSDLNNNPNALPAIATQCPPIKVRLGGEALFSYANNKIGDVRALNYQAVIDKQSRNCVVSNGLITVKMGVVGRVLLGPVGNKKQFSLPLRFVVERDDVAVFSQKYDIAVNVTPPNQTEEFVKVVENVAIPYLGGEDIVIWVGFDPK